jgi:hypothetical protein
VVRAVLILFHACCSFWLSQDNARLSEEAARSKSFEVRLAESDAQNKVLNDQVTTVLPCIPSVFLRFRLF